MPLTADQLRIGAHVDQTDPVAEAQVRGSSLVQFFLGDPQSYKGPEIRYAGGAEAGGHGVSRPPSGTPPRNSPPATERPWPPESEGGGDCCA